MYGPYRFDNGDLKSTFQIIILKQKFHCEILTQPHSLNFIDALKWITDLRWTKGRTQSISWQRKTLLLADSLLLVLKKRSISWFAFFLSKIGLLWPFRGKLHATTKPEILNLPGLSMWLLIEQTVSKLASNGWEISNDSYTFIAFLLHFIVCLRHTDFL